MVDLAMADTETYMQTRMGSIWTPHLPVFHLQTDFSELILLFRHNFGESEVSSYRLPINLKL